MIKLCDTHNDYLSQLPIDEIQNYALKSKDVLICASYWSTKKEEKQIQSDLTVRAQKLRSIDTCHLLHIEDMWWIKNKKALDNLLSLQPFSCSLTWNGQNVLASGSKAQGGLTEWGRKCISQLIDRNVLLDTAHLNRQSFFEVTKLVRRNLYCSHTGFYGIRRHKRNLTDKQINMIVKSDGFIGLYFYDDALKRTRSPFVIDDIISSIEYFTSRWGCDNLGFGTDFYGIDNYPQGIKGYIDFAKLEKALLSKGYSQHSIDKIFYKNFLNFCASLEK